MAIKPKYYETLYVVRPDIKEEELSKIQQKLNEALSAHEAVIIKSDKWAQRELAYEIKDYSRGLYYIIIFTAKLVPRAKVKASLPKLVPRAKVKASLPKLVPRAKAKTSLPKPLPRQKERADGITAR